MTLDEQLREMVRKLVREELAAARTASNDQEELLTTADAAALVRVRPATIRDWVSARRLSAVRVGRTLRVRRGDVIASMTTPVGKRTGEVIPMEELVARAAARRRAS